MMVYKNDDKMKFMFNKINNYIVIISMALFFVSCDGNEQDDHEGHDHEEVKIEETNHTEGDLEEVHFTEQQYLSLGMITDTIPLRNISSYVEANGQLEVPPQNEAAVTAIVGANVTKINVIEGEKVRKGQALAYLSHPELIRIQTNYVDSWSQLQYQEEEYKRQERLYNEKVGSGKEFQRVKANYLTTKAMARGYEAQLKLMGLDVMRVREGDIYEEVPVISPIGGYVRLVNVKMGQFAQPQTELFEIVNIEEIHADFMVFEKDMHKVKVGQKIAFSSESVPGKEMIATIHSVGKAFEPGPKAIHLHAEIENKEGLLIPGMYIRGRIMVDGTKSKSLPEEAIVREGDKYYLFTAKNDKEDGEWVFSPVEVIVGTKDDAWVEIKLLEDLPSESIVVWNNAYYIMAEMKKGEAGHSH
jgi:cobalt-zinc-cadmium efflux system membrane fusion protein